jgi:hypothetical protein
MTNPGSPSPDDFVGRFAVQASQQDIARFARTLFSDDESRGASGVIPTTFPITWLGRQDTREAILSKFKSRFGAKQLAPVHVRQTIAYDGLLFIDTPYWLDLFLLNKDERGLVGIEALVFDEQQIRQVRILGKLMLVPIALPA